MSPFMPSILIAKPSEFIPKNQISWQYESLLWQKGYSPVAGVDEAGRGTLAGPVTAAAVILPYQESYAFKDSKLLSAKKRREFAAIIQEIALAWAVAEASVEEVDRFNIARASRLAMQRALDQIGHAATVCDYVKLDDPRVQISIAKADNLSFQVAAASILAKESRDARMLELHQAYPHYGFAQHKGYGTKEHIAAITTYGPSPHHRRSFRPLKQMMQNQSIAFKQQ
ncbi:MAG: ribonuclease HII [Deinococcales bacterium]